MKRLIAVAVFAAALRAQTLSGVIDGIILDSATKAPVVCTDVSLEGEGVKASKTCGPSGDFRFENLRQGDYELKVTKDGYLDSEADGFAVQRVHLNAGSAAASVTISLVPFSAISGVVLDEDGQPITGVSLSARIGGGGPRVTASSGSEGRYRLENLRPGDYQIALHVPYGIRDKTLKRDSRTGETYGYASAHYYPGVDDPQQATAVSVPAGIRLQNFDIRLHRVLLVTLTGRVLETSGRAPLSGAEVALSRPGVPIVDAANYQRRAVKQNGGFQFDLIQPGHYLLLIFRNKSEKSLPYVAPLDVGKTGAEDLPVSVPQFVRIQGAVKTPDPKIPWEGALRVGLQGTVASPSEPVSVDKDGSFTLDNVPPGQWQLQLGSGSLREAVEPHRKLYAASASFGNQSVLTGPLTVVEGGNPPLEILLSNQLGGIAGNVSDGNSQLFFIVTAKVDGENKSIVDMDVSDPDGSFRIVDLPPGDYEVTASRMGFGNNSGNALKPCQQSAKVTVKAGEKTLAQVQPCK